MVTLFFAIVIAWIAAVPVTWVGRHPWRAAFAYGTVPDALPEVLLRSLGCVLLLRLYIWTGRAWIQRRARASTA